MPAKAEDKGGRRKHLGHLRLWQTLVTEKSPGGAEIGPLNPVFSGVGRWDRSPHSVVLPPASRQRNNACANKLNASRKRGGIQAQTFCRTIRTPLMMTIVLRERARDCKKSSIFVVSNSACHSLWQASLHPFYGLKRAKDRVWEVSREHKAQKSEFKSTTGPLYRATRWKPQRFKNLFALLRSHDNYTMHPGLYTPLQKKENNPTTLISRV